MIRRLSTITTIILLVSGCGAASIKELTELGPTLHQTSSVDDETVYRCLLGEIDSEKAFQTVAFLTWRPLHSFPSNLYPSAGVAEITHRAGALGIFWHLSFRRTSSGGTDLTYFDGAPISSWDYIVRPMISRCT